MNCDEWSGSATSEKRSVSHFEPARLSETYALIEQLSFQGDFPLIAVCHALEVSRAGYYAWLLHSNSAREQRDRELMPLVRHIFWQHQRR